MNQKILVELNNISFEYPGGNVVFEKINLSLASDSKIGLVGINGSGKTTLFKLILNQLICENGSVKSYGSIGYVPQIDTKILQREETLQDYLLIKAENWWNVYSSLGEIFNFNQELSIPMKSLSGGELMKIHIALALENNPSLLLLDEPTNHLDSFSVRQLIKILKSSNFAYLIISHDVFFLDQVVNEIWEIEDKKISVYGGNYSEYKDLKAEQIESKQRKYDVAKNKLKHIHDLKQKELTRVARSTKGRREAFLSGSISSSEYVGGEKGKATLSSGFVKNIEDMTQRAEEGLSKNKVFERKQSLINLKFTGENSGQTLIRVEDMDIRVSEKILIKNLNFWINFGERINIVGLNGSGKTTLVKRLLATDQLNSNGIYKKQNLKYLYIDQNYSLLNFEKNLVDNLIEYLPEISEDKAKEQLGKLQFKNQSDYVKLAKDLSGREMARLALAIVTTLPLDLLVLDEPTNNLDVETIEIMIDSLKRFKGTLIVISHNIEFLSRININKSYIIKNKELKEMMNLPVKKEEYFEEIIK